MKKIAVGLFHGRPDGRGLRARMFSPSRGQSRGRIPHGVLDHLKNTIGLQNSVDLLGLMVNRLGLIVNR